MVCHFLEHVLAALKRHTGIPTSGFDLQHVLVRVLYGSYVTIDFFILHFFHRQLECRVGTMSLMETVMSFLLFIATLALTD